ncbi:hypothetical protein TNCV_1521591 [Trichonephila clavipes]|nr:hypothetical protein TNCV_1521591 [Trichonephila clavipes]
MVTKYVCTRCIVGSESNAFEDLPSRGRGYTLNLLSSKLFRWQAVVVWRRGEVPAQCSPRHLTEIQRTRAVANIPGIAL